MSEAAAKQQNSTVAVKKNSPMAVSYDVTGTHVELTLDFVKQYLVRGKRPVSDQEAIFFMHTCKMQGLNPLVNGEVYLIKFDDNPAQMVVGKGAYMRRAYENPNYLGKTDGITVVRGKEVVQKEGCCLYPNETLIGGWCRVYYLNKGNEQTAFREVALSEYNKGQANWTSKPATMINKVAISQCLREAFPSEYQGIYSESEMVASGAVPAEYTVSESGQGESVVTNNGENVSDQQPPQVSNEEVAAEADPDPQLTSDQRREMFSKAKENFGLSANDVLMGILNGLGYSSTKGLRMSDYVEIMALLDEKIAMAKQDEPLEAV